MSLFLVKCDILISIGESTLNTNQSINQSIIFTKMRIIYFLSGIFVNLLKMRLATSDLHGLSFFLVKGYLNTPWYFSLLRNVLIRGTVMA